MYNPLRRVFLPAVIATLAASLLAQPAPSPSLAFQRQQNLLHGINASPWIGQRLESDGLVHDYWQQNRAGRDIALIRAMGFNDIRLVMSPPRLLNVDRPGWLNPEYVAALKQTVQLAIAHHLSVILDMHGAPDWNRRVFADPLQTKAFLAGWAALARIFAPVDPAHVFFECLNEPELPSDDQWAGVQARLIARLRQAAPENTIIADAGHWSSPPDLLVMEPYSDNNVIYNFHFYDPHIFTHQGATWSSPWFKPERDIPFPLTPQSALAASREPELVNDPHTRAALIRAGSLPWDATRIQQEIGAAAAWGTAHNVPLLCDEFGVYRNYSPPASRYLWLRIVRQTLEDHHIGWAMWSYEGGFGVVWPAPNHQVRPDLKVLQALGLHPHF